MEYLWWGESVFMGKSVIFFKKDLLCLVYFFGIYLSYSYDVVLDVLNVVIGVYKFEVEYVFLRIKLNKKFR